MKFKKTKYTIFFYNQTPKSLIAFVGELNRKTQ